MRSNDWLYGLAATAALVFAAVVWWWTLFSGPQFRYLDDGKLTCVTYRMAITCDWEGARINDEILRRFDDDYERLDP